MIDALAVLRVLIDAFIKGRCNLYIIGMAGYRRGRKVFLALFLVGEIFL
jgi:hypothetical protein